MRARKLRGFGWTRCSKVCAPVLDPTCEGVLEIGYD